jgi:hypothetical protein
MSTEIQIYSVDCSGEHRREPQEMGFVAEYAADSLADAVHQAVRFLDNRCKAFDLRPGCIKVSIKTVRRIAEDGHLQTRNGFPFFEWKHDTSLDTFDDLFRAATKPIGG